MEIGGRLLEGVGQQGVGLLDGDRGRLRADGPVPELDLLDAAVEGRVLVIVGLELVEDDDRVPTGLVERDDRAPASPLQMIP